MNIRATYKTMMKDFARGAAIYFSIMIAFMLIGICLLLVIDTDGDVGMNFDMSGYVFFFVFSLNSFKENLKFFNQNGVSRRTFYISRITVMVSAALIMMLMDRLLHTILSFVKIDNFSAVFVFDLFGKMEQNNLVNILKAMLASLCTYMAAYGLGCFINLVFYRLGNFGKTIVGAGVPVFCIILLPLTDNLLLNGALGRVFMKFINYTLSSLGNISLVFALISLACMVFTYFLMRRAPIKN